jgi:RNA recognition motif-containing protein
VYGELGSVKIEKNPDGTSKKFGFVCFLNSADAAKALSDKEKLGMYAAEYKRKDERAIEKLKKDNLNSRQALDVKIHVKGFEPNFTDEELS